jgi:hypothetical protein
MDEFEQALNHVYAPPSQSRSSRPVPLIAEVHATLLTHIRDRAEKPSTSTREEAVSSLELQGDARWDMWNKLANEPREARDAKMDAFDQAQFLKSSGAEEDTQAHVWRTKLGGLKVVPKPADDLCEEVRYHPSNEWRKAEIGGVDERTGWEKVLLGCLLEVRLLCCVLGERC